jgi:ubiquinol-cytochrome c reductase cytochrome b subunit
LGRAAPVDLAGVGYFRAAECSTCHDMLEEGPKPGPTLAGLVPRKSRDQLMDHFRLAKRSAPSTSSAPAGMKAGELDALTSFRDRPGECGARRPSDRLRAQIFVANGCGTCHTVNGVGGRVGPILNGVAQRHSREWIAQHLSDPESQTPDTVMPAFEFSAHDRDLLISYLLSLPGNRD